MGSRRRNSRWSCCLATVGWVFIIALLVVPPEVTNNLPLGALLSKLLESSEEASMEKVHDVAAVSMLPPTKDTTASTHNFLRGQQKEKGSIASDRGGVDYFELVVAWFCEDEKWFVDFEGRISVYSKNLACTNRLKKKLKSRPTSAGPVRVKELPNVGREGHSYIKHILDNWDTLATYTAFTQGAGHHNGISAMTQIRKFLKNKSEKYLLVPMVYMKDAGPMLYRDADMGDEFAKGGEDKDRNLWTFDYTRDLDMAGRAREVYASLFGGEACKAPPPIFIAGAQMIVHRDAIKAKPKKFWQHIYKTLADCYPYGWDFERLWVYVFDVKTAPAENVQRPGFCRTNTWKTNDCNGTFRKQEKPWQMPLVNS